MFWICQRQSTARIFISCNQVDNSLATIWTRQKSNKNGIGNIGQKAEQSRSATKINENDLARRLGLDSSNEFNLASCQVQFTNVSWLFRVVLLANSNQDIVGGSNTGGIGIIVVVVTVISKDQNTTRIGNVPVLNVLCGLEHCGSVGKVGIR